MVGGAVEHVKVLVGVGEVEGAWRCGCAGDCDKRGTVVFGISSDLEPMYSKFGLESSLRKVREGQYSRSNHY